MKLLLNQMTVFRNGAADQVSVLVDNGRIISISKEAPVVSDARVIEFDHGCLFPGFVDVHVHLREPGFSYKETIRTGTMACARGGYTHVCAMPNLNPAPDSDEHLRLQEEIIARDAVIGVTPYASITLGQKGEGELTDMAALAPRVAGFSDDGRGVKAEETMRQAMIRCKAARSLIAAHCEDMSLIPSGGAIHAGAYAQEHGIPGIPSESEWRPIERDLRLAKETGCRYHVCHVSCKESVALIRQAKAEGVDVTCETGPHYLLLCQDDLQDLGRFKMNPPLRDAADRDALVQGILDGTIDMIATDHAPHSAEEKSRGLAKSAMGVVGIESAFPLMYTWFVETERMPLQQLIRLMAEAPRARFGFGGGIGLGQRAELTVFDLHARETVNPADFLSMGRATPFEGWEVHAACRLTITGENIAYNTL